MASNLKVTMRIDARSLFGQGKFENDFAGTVFWTDQEWKKMSFTQRLWLRVTRDPLVYFCFTSSYIAITTGIVSGFVPG